jgi:hypothetical protein
MRTTLLLCLALFIGRVTASEPIAPDNAHRLTVAWTYDTRDPVDAETGAEIWRVNLGVARDVDYSDFANRGPAVQGDRLYVALKTRG